MIRTIAIAALALSLAACGTTGTKLPTITKNNYIAVEIDPTLLDLQSCPWPDKPVDGNESAFSNYMLDGFKAWACENDTRAGIKKQNDRQAADVAARNGKKAKPSDGTAVTSGATPEKKKGWLSFN